MNTAINTTTEFTTAADTARDLLASEISLVGGGDIVVGSY
jgi:hypothetical protein